MTNDAGAWPEFAEWQELALKERDFRFARGYRGLSDEEVDAILGPIEERLDLLEQPVMDEIVEMNAEEALGLSARTPAGVRVKMQALAYLSGKRDVEGLSEKLRELEKELAMVAA